MQAKASTVVNQSCDGSNRESGRLMTGNTQHPSGEFDSRRTLMDDGADEGERKTTHVVTLSEGQDQRPLGASDNVGGYFRHDSEVVAVEGSDGNGSGRRKPFQNRQQWLQLLGETSQWKTVAMVSLMSLYQTEQWPNLQRLSLNTNVMSVCNPTMGYECSWRLVGFIHEKQVSVNEG